jgi:hypothetical protein
MTDGLSGKDIEHMMSGMLSSIEEEYQTMTEEEVASKWYFTFDPSKSMESNLYEFNGMLDMYRSSCRRWESMHNGNRCVVERVRDKYLMPKIREFSEQLRDTYGMSAHT